MSRDGRIPQQGSIPRSPDEQVIPKSRKIFTKSNFFKVFLPSLILIGIILTPVIFEAFNVRHQSVDDVIEAEPPSLPGDRPDNFLDYILNESNDFMDEFTNGFTDPEQIVFRVSPADEYFNWRLEIFDTYTMDNWEKNTQTTEIFGNPTHPYGDADGIFTVEGDLAYANGLLTNYFPAPYHYEYNELFADNTYFEPNNEWIEENTIFFEDMYGGKIISARFEPTMGNTTIFYDTYYTVQNNSEIRQNSEGFSSLAAYIASDPTLTNRYLQLPTDYSTQAPDTVQIANSLLNTSNTIYNQVYRDMFWLASNCTYDIDMLLGLSTESPAIGEDFVEWFIDRRMGVSAHYAAALSIICRLQNIPSRIVLGFSSGDLVGNEFLIRVKHIHSWIEVFIPMASGGYWVAFDPSPLIPGLRDQFGVNTIGFETVFYCSNEFFISPAHMLPQPSYPYFVPNPLSTAWYSDPYNPGTWYGPYVNRSQSFSITAFLANGNDNDFFGYMLGLGPGDLDFVQGEQITFIDITSSEILGSAITDIAGEATISYAYNASAESGLHYIVAEWQGIRTPTYDLRYIPLSFVETGVIVTGSVNITSSNPYPRIGTINIPSSLNLFDSLELVSSDTQQKNMIAIFQTIFLPTRFFI